MYSNNWNELVKNAAMRITQRAYLGFSARLVSSLHRILLLCREQVLSESRWYAEAELWKMCVCASVSGEGQAQTSADMRTYLFSLSIMTLNNPLFAFFLGSSAVACWTIGATLSNVMEDPGLRVMIFFSLSRWSCRFFSRCWFCTKLLSMYPAARARSIVQPELRINFGANARGQNSPKWNAFLVTRIK